ncbi:MAG: hypothetical protein LBE86_11470 [Gemmobacter sp.]|jgi:hypothetical protein|nr:hypothetical protein [Gemmobacter sp.]
MSGGGDRPGVARIWGIVFALSLIMLALLIGMLIWTVLAAIDWTAVLRLIAPTAFETRPIEEILDGGRR